MTRILSLLLVLLCLTPVATAATCNGVCYQYNETQIEQCCESTLAYEGLSDPEGIVVCMPYGDAQYSCTNFTLISGGGGGGDEYSDTNGESEESENGYDETSSSSSKIESVVPTIGFQLLSILCIAQAMVL